MQPDPSTKGIAARWRNIRRLYPIYLAISHSFQVGPQPPYGSISAVTEEHEPDAIEHAERWMALMDAHIQPHHLRQVMQQTDVAATEPRLLALVQRHASKGNRSQLDSDKLNFVMTQYLWACAPPSFRSREITVLDAAEVLEPVIGAAPSDFAPWLKPLQDALEQLRVCHSVAELIEGSFVERGRELRAQLGARYFERSSLLLFAYYNFCLRQGFQRSIQSDARHVEEGLEQLRRAGLDPPIRVSGQAAPLSVSEMLHRVHEIAGRAAGEYGVDEAWKELPELRIAVDMAVANSRSSVARAPEDRVAQLGDRLQQLLEQIDSVRNELASLRQAGILKPIASPSYQQEHPPAVQDSGFHIPLDVTPPESARKPAPVPIPEAASRPAPEPPRPDPPAAPPEVETRPVPTSVAPEAQLAAEGDPFAAAAEMSKQLQHLRTVLSSAKSATGLVPIGNTAIVLSAAEIDAVLSGTDESSELIRQATAARMALVEKLELTKTGHPQDFSAIRKAAGDVQNAINGVLKASPRKPSDALSITSRQLAAVLRAVPRR